MKKKILIAIIAILLPLFAIVSIASSNRSSRNIDNEIKQDNDIMINSPLFTAKETNKQYNQPASSLTADGFMLAASNSKFELYVQNKDVDKATGAIRIKNLETGFIWSSDYPEIVNDEDIKLTTAQLRKIQSSFQMSYRDGDNKPQSIYTTTNNVKLSWNVKGNVVTYTAKYSKAKIEFEYTVELTETGIDLKLEHEKIKETGDCKLTGLTFFSYLGSAYKSTIPGYVFIPSGNGGLIRYEANSSINSLFSQSYYGTDANRNKDTEGNMLSIPVYGVAHGVNQNAMLVEIKDGSAFAQFNYSPSSLDDFHQVYNSFNYRQTYNLTIPGAESLLMVPNSFYKSNIEVSYSFLGNEDADYVGMAKCYQRSLKKDGIINENNKSGSNNVHIDVLGGETEKDIIFDKFIKMTTTNQLKQINTELAEEFDNHFVYTLRGFYKGGYSKQSYGNIKYNSSLGSLNVIKDLNYYMYYNPVESYGSSKKTPSHAFVNVYNENHYITMEENVKYKYYTNVNSVISGVNKVNGKYEHVALDGIGYRLYGDKNCNYTREEVLDKYSELLNSKTMMFKPNEYFFANTSEYLNMPLYHERLRFITDSVPFLQIALRGYIDYYSTYLNFSTNQDIDILKCIEYGSNPAYLISYEQSYKLANSLSSHLYATHYESNKELIFSQINDINLALGDVKSQTIVERNVLETGIVEVTYSNGTIIYVNYTNTPYSVNGLTVDGMDFKVVRA